MEQEGKSKDGIPSKMNKSYLKVSYTYHILNIIDLTHLKDRDTHKKLETDAMFKLNHDFADKNKKLDAAPDFHDIVDKRSDWKDDYSLNKMARQVFRVI